MTRRVHLQTPSQTVGPFFHLGMASDGTNVLAGEAARGERIRIEGRVLDGDGEAVPDALVEIWQPDADGIFPHPADPQVDLADPHFRGFGRADTRDGGRYSFETVKPGVAAAARARGEASCIGVRVFARGLLVPVITRIYFEDEDNGADPVWSRVAPDRRHTLVARREEGTGTPVYRFDVRLQGEDETVFFDP